MTVTWAMADIGVLAAHSALVPRAIAPTARFTNGNGLYGPDPYSSPHNRDARQRYIGPGYIGSCDLSGCREVHQFGFYDLR